MRGSRIAREKRTVSAMVRMYCRGVHGRTDLCEDCKELLRYSERRLDVCPFKDSKPTCARCTVHCFEASMRARMRSVMRYSGPRMFIRHPVLAVAHVSDRRTEPPGKTRGT
jgi:predicted amidophosphoribosyltransferase